jgi:hypothetical protein
LSLKTTLAERVPAAAGVKVTVRPQDAPAASVEGPTGHVFAVMAKSEAFVPVTATLEIVTAVFPVLCTVKLRALELPVVTVGKVRLEGLKLSVSTGTWPVPVRPMDWGLPAALSVIEMEALRTPPAVGENVAETVQAALAASVAGLTGHVLADMAKSPAFAPASAKLVILTALLPVLVTVTLCAALVVPVFCVAKVRLVEVKLSV